MGIFDKMKELKKNVENSDGVGVLKHLEGIPQLPEGETVTLIVSPQDDKLYLSRDGNKDGATPLEFSRIQYVESTNADEITEKNKSVIGRAAVGSLLGPIGTVVGGMSGVGSKKKKKEINVLVIGYEKDGEMKQISFMGGKGTLGYNIALGKLRQCVDNEDKSIKL